MAKKFATGNSGRLFKDLEISELKEQNIILDRQGEREEERFYENRIYQIKLQMAQATDEQQLVLLEEMLSQEIANLEEVKEINRQNEKRRRMMYFIPFILVFLLFVVGALYILFTPSKKNNEDKTAILNSSSSVVSSTSTSSTTKSSPSTSKSEEKQTTTTSPTTRPQATKVYIGNFIGRKSTDVVAELKEKNIPENLIKIVEKESSETEAGLVMKQSLPEGTTYDLSKATEITLTVAKKSTSATMPNYVGSSLEFAKNNLIHIVGIKEANIEVVEVSTAPEGTAEETVVSQSPKPGEGVDLNNTRIKISIYKPKTTQTSQGRSR